MPVEPTYIMLHEQAKQMSSKVHFQIEEENDKQGDHMEQGVEGDSVVAITSQIMAIFIWHRYQLVV
eukprot:scaffold498187_cov25-Prasinocladus_malaysianus.AAC.1